MKFLIIFMLVECILGDVSHVVNKYLPPVATSYQSQTVQTSPQTGYVFQGSTANAIQNVPSSGQFVSAPQTVTTKYTPTTTQQAYRSSYTSTNVVQKPAPVYTTQTTYTPTYTSTGPSAQTQYSTSGQQGYVAVAQAPVLTYQKSYTIPTSQQTITVPVVQKSYVTPSKTFQTPYTGTAIQTSYTMVAPQTTTTFVAKAPSYQVPVSYAQPVTQQAYSKQVQQTVQTSYVKPIQMSYTVPTTKTVYSTPVIQMPYTAPKVQQTYVVPDTPTYKSSTVQVVTSPLNIAQTQYSLPTKYDNQLKSDINLNTRYDKNGGYVY